MKHAFTYTVTGIEHNTGLAYETMTTVGISDPSKANELISKWNSLSRTGITFTLLHVKYATPEQQLLINKTSHFKENNILRSGIIQEHIKTPAAKKALMLLDADEDAPQNYPHIVNQVASEVGITTAQLEFELAPFI